jgi:hypothetical protein
MALIKMTRIVLQMAFEPCEYLPFSLQVDDVDGQSAMKVGYHSEWV